MSQNARHHASSEVPSNAGWQRPRDAWGVNVLGDAVAAGCVHGYSTEAQNPAASAIAAAVCWMGNSGRTVNSSHGVHGAVT